MTLLKPTKQELLIAIGIIFILMAFTGVIFFPGCGKPTVHTITVRDTVKLIHYDTVISKPKIITRIKEPLPPELVPSEDCNQLKLQFQDLSDECVKDTLIINEYEFDEDGDIW